MLLRGMADGPATRSRAKWRCEDTTDPEAAARRTLASAS